jgi:glucose-1-phosphate thymidylyltransferase
MQPQIRKYLSLQYLERLKIKKLNVENLGRGSSWLDTGTAENLFETSQFISNIEKRQGLKIACLEEIALNNKWISKKQIEKRISFYGDCDYSRYLRKVIK